MTLLQRVGNVLSALCGREVTDMTQTLRGDLQMDSLAQVTLLLMLEDEFGFTLRENDMDPYALETVADTVALVGRYTEDGNDEKED